MILKYPGVAGKPMVLAVVECLMTRKRFLVPMLLDTGADETCFPGRFAAFFGHNNHHPGVIRKKCRGVGGDSVAYVHSIQLSLLHPDKSSASRPHVAWTAPAKRATFIEKLDCGFGLLGMDIISKWKEMTLQPEKTGITILISP